MIFTVVFFNLVHLAGSRRAQEGARSTIQCQFRHFFIYASCDNCTLCPCCGLVKGAPAASQPVFVADSLLFYSHIMIH